MRAMYLGILVCAAVGLVLAPAARGDWKEGMPYKMHYPQLPDPLGWDVQDVRLILADDFLCTETGPITDVHLWGSFQHDMGGVGLINNIHLSIHDNDVTGLFSKPGNLLWQADFGPNDFKIQQSGTGPQGWLDPSLPPPIPQDHWNIYQINITNIRNPFVQEVDNVYWLDVQVTSLDSQFGWKTSRSPHFMDDAVWGMVPADGPGGPTPIAWQPLEDPFTGASLDMAFVITPEPATMALLGLGAAGFLARRRRK